MANAITNKIKTEFTTYFAKEDSDGELAENLQAMRVSDNGIEGAMETIESDVKLPDTRIQSTPENGAESSSGDITTEWNIDEQDDWLAAVMCQDAWTSEEITDDETTAGVIEKTSLELGEEKVVYSMIKKENQTPQSWRYFKGLQLNTLKIDMELNAFVKMTWSWMGQNYPEIVTEDPIGTDSAYAYQDALTTKSFLTLTGYLYYGSSLDDLTQLRQASNFELTISNNKEVTNALFETEAIEMSDGDFTVEGTLDIWKADDTAISLMNSAINGDDMCFSVIVERTVTEDSVDFTYDYEIQLKVHMNAPSESKDGNKLKVSLPFVINAADGIKILKTKAAA